MTTEKLKLLAETVAATIPADAFEKRKNLEMTFQTAKQLNPVVANFEIAYQLARIADALELGTAVRGSLDS